MGRRYSAPSSLRGKRHGLLRNQLTDLILFGFLVTTETRAKALKSEAERLISRAKKADLSTRRKVLALLPKRSAAEKLFGQVVPQFSAKGGKERVGGYVRVVKLPSRRGDNAPMARVEFVEEIKKEEVAETAGKVKGKSASRRGKAEKHSPSRAPGGIKDDKKDKSNKSK